MYKSRNATMSFDFGITEKEMESRLPTIELILIALIFISPFS